MPPFIASDPNAWLRPYWADLHRQPFFARLAPELQAEALAAALADDHPAKADEIRDWNPTTRRAMLAVLEQARAERHVAKSTALWELTQGHRRLSCVAVYVSTGIDLRLLDGTDIRRTELFQWSHHLHARSQQWRDMLLKTGWKTTHAEADPRRAD